MRFCPRCSGTTIVRETVVMEDGEIARRRKCTKCDYRFWTAELVMPDNRIKSVGDYYKTSTPKWSEQGLELVNLERWKRKYHKRGVQ